MLQPDEAVTSATASQEWSAFLNYTTTVLHPYEHCDSMRHNSRPGESATISHRSHIENRYFHFRSVRLTYLTCMGRNAHHGVWWPGDANSLRKINPAGTPWRWELPNASSVVTRLLPMLRPTHVVYFVGGVHLRMQQARRLLPMCHLYHPLASMRSWLPRVWSGRHTLISIVTRPAEVLSALLLTRNCALSMRRFVRRDSRASL